MSKNINIVYSKHTNWAKYSNIFLYFSVTIWSFLNFFLDFWPNVGREACSLCFIQKTQLVRRLWMLVKHHKSWHNLRWHWVVSQSYSLCRLLESISHISVFLYWEPEVALLYSENSFQIDITLPFSHSNSNFLFIKSGSHIWSYLLF